MYLLEFRYWSDVVMGLTIFIALGVVAIIILVSMILCKINKQSPIDNDEKLRQEIFDKLNKIIADIKSTI